MKVVVALAQYIVNDGERLFVGNINDSLHVRVSSGGSRVSTKNGGRTPW